LQELQATRDEIEQYRTLYAQPPQSAKVPPDQK
jgi:hypothetical protein